MLAVDKKNSKRIKLLSDHQILDLAQKVVQHYVNKGTIPEKEKEDIQMGIVEKFLQKHEQINNAYNGQAKASTYYIAVLNKMCCEHIRKEIKYWKQKPTDEIEPGQTTEALSMEKLVINDEIKLLDNIIRLFANDRFKIRLFLAYVYRLIIYETDIKLYDKNYLKHKLKQLFKKSEPKSKSEIFENLSIAVQRAENKNVKADAVRMWLNKSIDKIIVKLNGPFNRANYDKESAQILFEYYYAKLTADKRTLKKRGK
ncbi:MAG: hypothetical protein N4A71_14715 [Carboxylicivirga sp.]|jgi:hypothetical protein|nr:hypothetical protein [Carboxylicivirga sp.]